MRWDEQDYETELKLSLIKEELPTDRLLVESLIMISKRLFSIGRLIEQIDSRLAQIIENKEVS